MGVAQMANRKYRLGSMSERSRSKSRAKSNEISKLEEEHRLSGQSTTDSEEEISREGGVYFQEDGSYVDGRSDFDTFKIHGVLVALLVLAVISVLFVNSFGRNYSCIKSGSRGKKICHNRTSTKGLMLDFSLASSNDADLNSHLSALLEDITEERADRIRIEDLQMAFKLLIRGLDETFDDIERKVNDLRDDFSSRIEEHRNYTESVLLAQFENLEKKTVQKTDYLEELISGIKARRT